jgi:glycosyltransferase involved in cell wall biosynthesis
MKALFLIFHGFDPSNGISQKIQYQLKALKNCGLDTCICYMQEEHGFKKRFVDHQVIADYGCGIKSKILKRIEFGSIADYVIINHIQFVYMRSDHNANFYLIEAIHKMKCHGVKIVMEIPTYPYDVEYVGWSMKKRLIQDKLFRRILARQLDAIVTFSDEDRIFGQRTIRISNGIDFDSIPLKKHLNDTSHELHLIGVAEIHRWHGFDRVIRGLAAYYQTNPDYKVYFHIVGYFYSDTERNEITTLINTLDLREYIILHGKQHGEALNQLFEQCDFGIGSLGRHRVGITNIKTLKNREYAARGIPFIYSEHDSDFENQPYVLKATATDEPVDINDIIDFYRSLNLTPAQIRISIQSLSWNNQMRKVVDEVIS